MSKRRKAPPAKRPWRPLQPATVVPRTDEHLAALRAEAERMGMSQEAIERLLAEEPELWKNDRYTVTVRRHPEIGFVAGLSVRRNDRKPDMPWRHLQRIKSQLAGDEAEAFELYPAESRLVDTANQRWLWCLPPGEKIPVGFNDGRHVTGPEDAERLGAKQAAL